MLLEWLMITSIELYLPEIKGIYSWKNFIKLGGHISLLGAAAIYLNFVTLSVKIHPLIRLPFRNVPD